MFQTYEDRSERAAGPGRVAALRDLLRSEELAGFIVPHADEHQSEYLPASAERLAWLTGFTGSAGLAIVLIEEAALFVDGRYTLQAAAQVDPAALATVPLAEIQPAQWLATRLRPGDRIGYDPWLLTETEARRLETVCREASAEWIPVADNPIDRLWTDRPSPPMGAVGLHPASLAGEDAVAKLARLSDALSGKKADAAVLTQADSVAWTFNIRGADVAHNPVPLAFAILRRGGRPSLYVDGRKLSNAVRHSLGEVADIAEPSAFEGDLLALASSDARILVDPHTAASAVVRLLREADGILVEGPDPTLLPKARKNAAELEGAREAHRRDGIALVRFLAWLDRTAPSGAVDEIGAAEMLTLIRAETARESGSELVDISFDTIAGAGPHGAIVHYRVTRATNRPLEAGSLFLIDSGGQYRDGTTDVTRTVAIGAPTAEMRDRFTRVLKGHIALASARFPAGTTGAQLDTLARLALWQAGLDYDHGTGHGVGSFLSVHEGPARIAKTGTIPLEPGMILSNEPGYYRTGEYGIRIENLIAVREPARIPGGERPMLDFETLTLAPIDRRLIAPELLTPAESEWLDAYHRRVWETLGPSLDEADRQWLQDATRPVA